MFTFQILWTAESRWIWRSRTTQRTSTRMRWRGSRELEGIQVMMRSDPGREEVLSLRPVSWSGPPGQPSGENFRVQTSCVLWDCGRNVPLPLSPLLHPESSLKEEASGMSKVPCQLTAFSSSL